MSNTSDSKHRAESRWTHVAWAMVRIWTGIFFLALGMIQLPAQLNSSILVGLTQESGLAAIAPFQQLELGGFMPILQVIIGMLLIMGGFTPYAAMAGLGITLWAILPAGLDLTSSATTVAVLTLVIILSRAGRFFGMDALLHRRVHLPLL